MPELRLAERHWQVAPGGNLLDELLAAGIDIPFGCRAGSCHACLVRCCHGLPQDGNPQALTAEQREQGWRLACQCRVVEDMQLELFAAQRDGLSAKVLDCHWLSPGVLRLRVSPDAPLAYQAGQHLMLWRQGVGRPYSLASVPSDPWLEFHLDCRHSGAFADQARQLRPGDGLRLGGLRGGALHYDPAWRARPLWLMAAGTGLAPLQAVLREALAQGHQGEIRLLHLACEPAEHYLIDALQALAARHCQVLVQCLDKQQLGEVLASLRLVSRQTLALLCGSPANVEQFARRAYLAGVPRNQVFADVFVPYPG